MSSIDYIIVGLGNPGKEYEKTRHNIGFMTLDFIAENLNIKLNSQKFKAVCGSGIYNNKQILLLKPQTYMNLSGQSIINALSFYKLNSEKTILIFDDISLPVGKLRIRQRGSHGGHNGVRNIIELCGTDNFPRIKLGVGSKPNEHWDLADWVLSKFNHYELKILDESMKTIYEALKMILDDHIKDSMNKFN